jgi:hypothetical protein
MWTGKRPKTKSSRSGQSGCCITSEMRGCVVLTLRNLDALFENVERHIHLALFHH